MATPKCPNPNCQSTNFCATSQHIADLNRNITFICCGSCGRIVGVIDNALNEIFAKLQKQAEIKDSITENKELAEAKDLMNRVNNL